MGLSHLLGPTTRSLKFNILGYSKQSRAFCATPSSKRARCSKEQKFTAVESCVKNFMETHPGIFPTASHVRNEVGGSWYYVKDILLKVKEKIVGTSQVQSHSSDQDNLNSTDTISHNNISGKPCLSGPESTLPNALGNKSDTSAVPCISRTTSSENITDAVASEANMNCTNLNSTEIGELRNIIQSSEASSRSDGEHNNVRHTTRSSTEGRSSANMLNTMASEVTGWHDTRGQTIVIEAACEVPLSTVVPDSSGKHNNLLTSSLSHLNGDIVKAENASDSLNMNQSRKEQMVTEDLWNKKPKVGHFSGLMHEFSTTLKATTGCERPSTVCTNHVESKATDSSVLTTVWSELGKSPSFFGSTQRNSTTVEKSKSLELSSAIHDVTRKLQERNEDKLASTGRHDQVGKTKSSSFKTNEASKLAERPLVDGGRTLVGFMDLLNKKLDEQSEVKADNGHLKSEGTLSGLLVSPLDQTTDISASTRDRQNEPDNQSKISHLSSNVVADGDVVPASDDAQKIKRLADVWKNMTKGKEEEQMRMECNSLPPKAIMDDSKERVRGNVETNLSRKVNRLADVWQNTTKGKEEKRMTTKCNSLQPKAILEDSKERVGGNMETNFNTKILSECIKTLAKGKQVVGNHGSMGSSKTDQNRTSDHIGGVQSQANMQKVGNEEKETSSLYQDLSESLVSLENPKKTPVASSVKALHVNKVLVKCLKNTADEKDILTAFTSFGGILKTEVSQVRHNFKMAALYFETREGMEKALQAVDVSVKGDIVIVEPASCSKSLSTKISVPNLIGDPNAPAALLKNPVRTVAIKELTGDICLRHIEEALTFCDSKISGVFLGSSSDVAYVEFETEDAKERALAKFSIQVLGKQLSIFRIDTPITTVVRLRLHEMKAATLRLPEIQAAVAELKPLVKSCGKYTDFRTRHGGCIDVHFSITEWPNMVQILNKLNGQQVMGHQLLAEPAPVFPPNVLRELYSRPDKRQRLKAIMLKVLEKLDNSAVHKVRLTTKIAEKLYGEP